MPKRAEATWNLAQNFLVYAYEGVAREHEDHPFLVVAARALHAALARNEKLLKHRSFCQVEFLTGPGRRPPFLVLVPFQGEKALLECEEAVEKELENLFTETDQFIQRAHLICTQIEDLLDETTNAPPGFDFGTLLLGRAVELGRFALAFGNPERGLVQLRQIEPARAQRVLRRYLDKGRRKVLVLRGTTSQPEE
jgi:hypothetical protein